jgi:hypothetical protein
MAGVELHRQRRCWSSLDDKSLSPILISRLAELEE